MKVSDFDFDLPEERIATHPVEPRDMARLLQVSRFFFDFTFRQLPDLLHPCDVVVFNDSKVIPARLFGACDEKQFEVLLHKPHHRHPRPRIASIGDRVPPIAIPETGCSPLEDDGLVWTAFIRPLKKLKLGDVLHFDEGLHATLIEKKETGEAILSFVIPAQAGIHGEGGLDSGLRRNDVFYDILRRIGHMPLPPYIKREDTKADASDYQTIYARHEGSVAAPTAGLHFTPELMARLKEKGIQVAFVTLHVGAGTFQPVKVEDTTDHVMHSEWATISPEAADAMNAAKAAGGKVVAVGTTSLRILETVADEQGVLRPFSGDTDIFITPGYRFKIVDRLITNFHLPKSTLFMLVCAFAGTQRMKAAYDHAIKSGYRFYSYGDGCLLDRG